LTARRPAAGCESGDRGKSAPREMQKPNLAGVAVYLSDMKISMALMETIADWVMKVLPHDSSDTAVVAALRKKHPAELLTLYFNWQSRLVPTHPRKVQRSAEFDQNPIAAARSVVLAEIIRDIEQGADLTKYLSRRVRIGFELPRDPDKKHLSSLKHLDLLLNEWGVHHFHLSTNAESDGFVERDDPLLFLMFRANNAYLLDIGTHKSFADDKLARIAVTNWPNDQLFLELKGVVGLQRGSPYTVEERKKLRSAGLSSFIQIDNRVFSAAGGISTAGTAARASLWANRVIRELRKFEEHVLADSSQILAFIRKHGAKPANPPEFEFALFQNGFGVIERSSGFPIVLRGSA
jgi:hypothetical protein